MRDTVGSKTHDGFSVLAIGAHPDDIELGCGGSLAKLASAGARIQAVIFSKGRRGTLSDADRERESHAALATLGVRDVAIYDFEDTKLTYSLNEMIGTLDEHVRSFNPDRVYTMFQHDRHQDHRAVYEASAVSCRHVAQLLGYETPSSYPNFTPTVFEQIDGHLKTKIRALNCHTSQGDRLYMQEEKVCSAASFRGVQILLGACEGFIPYKIVL
ncbi:MAG: PIG-L family deacetylase [Alphaproteobacteria bacterium]|nr:PIG-L family deacetylase [Alphaproteobacteria bacterium]